MWPTRCRCWKRSIKFSYEDGAIKYTLSKEFVISDALFTKLKNLFRNLHDTWLQYFHRTVIQKKLLNANVPDIPEDADGFGDIDPDDLNADGLVDTTPPEDTDEEE